MVLLCRFLFTDRGRDLPQGQADHTRPARTIEAGGRRKVLFVVPPENRQTDVSFVWYHSDEPVKPSDNVVIVNSDESLQLTIKEMHLADSGPYVCKVENAHGSDSSRVDLKLNGRFWLFTPVLCFPRFPFSLFSPMLPSSETEMDQAAARRAGRPTEL